MRLCELLHRCRNLQVSQKLDFLHSERHQLNSNLLQREPLNFKHYLHRAAIHYGLGYSDLAAGDAYKALTLLETYFDPDFSDFHPELRDGAGEVVSWPRDDQAINDARAELAECFRCLVLALIDLRCLRDAYSYLLQLEKLVEEGHVLANHECQELRDLISRANYSRSMKTQMNGQSSEKKIELARLRNSGFARREIYKWNNHEPERSSLATRNALNKMLDPIAPHLEIRNVELPVLQSSAATDCVHSQNKTNGSPARSSQQDRSARSLQLGVFAKTDLPASSEILHEPSVLTAVRPLDASLCHNCGVPIPQPSSTTSDCLDGPVCCPSCTDAAVFCSLACLDIAQTKYHSTACGNDFIDPLGRDETSTNPSEDLYFLLLARAFSMSHSQNTHPLELPETKYLCGVFTTPSPSECSTSSPSAERTLPFTFHHNIVLPFRLLSILSESHPEFSPFSPVRLEWYDTWVSQTLYAKFRGVASARQSTWDGKPEVAAVHPFWCLANHSCSPNVEWGWDAGRERVFRVRARPVPWGKGQDVAEDGNGEDGNDVKGTWHGVRAGEEILTHYCDIDLPVKERREYMLGSLGGECICERCVWEAEQEHC
ncbi:hypothetical protein EPUS_02156 [Endocarpon pusillum Z07020]|uniref:SET domain-containing protein n=1 Tax=Endocarpon pusillum (strain Z07020 / HMAS-L-300199) TaxID=1263415 RepID=U1HSS5_ENDPU|nr:uncharacterized protein EPUS_02156 [Endocarpon pusillum Z07020]ERF72269.1 hypothetical protein EPUS_02156 [Endocarpon pusillum Z07020]